MHHRTAALALLASAAVSSTALPMHQSPFNTPSPSSSNLLQTPWLSSVAPFHAPAAGPLLFGSKSEPRTYTQYLSLAPAPANAHYMLALQALRTSEAGTFFVQWGDEVDWPQAPEGGAWDEYEWEMDVVPEEKKYGAREGTVLSMGGVGVEVREVEVKLACATGFTLSPTSPSTCVSTPSSHNLLQKPSFLRSSTSTSFTHSPPHWTLSPAALLTPSSTIHLSTTASFTQRLRLAPGRYAFALDVRGDAAGGRQLGGAGRAGCAA